MDAGNSGKIPAVMVVDDDWLNLELMEGILNVFGFEAILAHDGESALSLLAERRPDLLMIDVRMPDMDGYTLCRQIKVQDSTIPVMLVTAYEIEAEEIRQAEGAGADKIIQRGGRIDAVIDSIRALL